MPSPATVARVPPRWPFTDRFSIWLCFQHKQGGTSGYFRLFGLGRIPDWNGGRLCSYHERELDLRLLRFSVACGPVYEWQRVDA